MQFLKNPGKYKSCSAFAPIANPINAPWGQKAFKGYFGEDQQEKWKEHDATELVKKWKGPLDLLIDVVCSFNCLPFSFPFFVPAFYVPGSSLPITELLSLRRATGLTIRPSYAFQGTGDNFYKQGQLLPENFAKAAKESGNEKGVNIRYQPDYDHSYYTMASFADDHVEHAAKYLFA